MENDFKIEEDIQNLSVNELIDLYKEVESFIKLVDEELKKTNIGDEDE
jgi:hypothetical protein